LDVGTEALVQDALDRLIVDRTAIIIAHRLSTIRNVDRIFVLKQGSLIESGDHDQLLQQVYINCKCWEREVLQPASLRLGLPLIPLKLPLCDRNSTQYSSSQYD
jgi:ABC-type protease/lipase transport system fused ATPase/permease subunit